MGREQPIGVFDSGVGGLTVLKALRHQLPDEQFLYLGDTARLPYGTKSAHSVVRYSLQAADLLVQRGIKLLVVACNTASAYGLEALANHYPGLPVVGVIEPGARAACSASRTGHIGVLATESTVTARAYQQAIKRLRPGADVHALASPLLVTLAEEGWLEGDVPRAIVRHYLDPLLARFADRQLDCLVLGCTHFPVLSATFEAAVGTGISLVDSAQTTAKEVARRLESDNLRGTRPAAVSYLASDGVERFARVGSVFLGEPLSVEQIELVDLQPVLNA